MKSSKYVIIDQNILLEYIYDDQLLISERYNVLVNSNFGTRTFVSTIGSETNNDLRNTIYKIDSTFDRYGSIVLDPLVPEKIDDSISSIQSKNFAASIPIRYDELRIHLPVNWTFGDYKGCYARVYTYNFDESLQIDLSNYYFDISDVELINKMEYSPNLLLHGQRQWGKYLKVQFPSITKVSDQRRDNITIPNSINSNISNGVGLSKKSPVFIDFHFIQSISIVNGGKFFSLAPRITTLFPQTPDFENIGVMIEESTQGDFYVIYGTYNGSLGEFNIFLNESYYTGNRYYLEYVVDLYERNELIKSQTFLVNEEFNQIIEYRPIIKFSTTTAMIQVTMKIIDNTNGDTITRKSSVGIIQENVSKYSRYLSKINLRKANKIDVTNIKSIIQPKTGDDPLGTRPILILDKLPYTVYSSEFYVYIDKENIEFSGRIWTGLDKAVMNIFPYDNICKFYILESGGGDSYQPYDLTSIQNVKLTIKSDKKTLDFPIYQDSDQNQPEFGEVVFKISQSKYNELRSLNLEGTNLFYINGIDISGNRIIVYSGVFLPFDSPLNTRRLENDWISSQRQPDPPRPRGISEEQRLQNKISELSKEEIKPSGIKSGSLLFNNKFQNFNIISSSIKRVPLNLPNQTSQSLTKPGQPKISGLAGQPFNKVLIAGDSKIKTWVLKRKSLATLRNFDYSWFEGSPVTVYDIYVKNDNSGSTIKPTSDNISDFKSIRAVTEDEAKQIAFSTISGLNSGNWKKSTYPYFENIIYSPLEATAFKVRAEGGGIGNYATIDDQGRIYYLEEINFDI
jgi:hypothetical protein